MELRSLELTKMLFTWTQRNYINKLAKFIYISNEESNIIFE